MKKEEEELVLPYVVHNMGLQMIKIETTAE